MKKCMTNYLFALSESDYEKFLDYSYCIFTYVKIMYERYFTDKETGETYHHIIDPRTGKSARSGLTSVPIVSRDGALADGLSTSLFIMGIDEAFRFWKSGVYDFEALFIDEGGHIYITPGLSGMIYDTPGVTVLE